jgi:probable HAF family extracellular repeat protein
MKTNPLLAVTAIAFCVLILLPSRVHANAIAYSVTDLGLGEAFGINSSGQVSGSSGGDAVLWTGTTPTILNSVSATTSQGNGINTSGQVAGYFHTSGVNASPAARWTGATQEILVNSLGGTYSEAYGINASGQVAGYSYLANNSVRHAVRWTGTTQTDLGTLGGTNSIGYGINDSGQVAGWANNTQGQQRAVRWTGNTPTDLGLGLAYGINLSGQVVGTGGVGRAMVWTGTTPTDLGTLGGSTSRGLAINDSGDVVGMSYITGNIAQHAFLYTEGRMFDLFTLLVPGSGVTNLTIDFQGNAINNSGQIAATGTINGQQRALRLDLVVVPEPSSILLLASTALLAGVRRFKRTSPSPSFPSLK